MRRNGAAFQLHVDHWGGQPGRTHAPVPFYVSTKGYGVFIDSARYINLNVGAGVRLAAPGRSRRSSTARRARARGRRIRARIRSKRWCPPLAWRCYVFAGPTPMDAMRRYNLFGGGGALPPKWGLGFMTRTPTRYTAAQALDEVAEFRKRGIPLDMLGLEPGWHDHAYPMLVRVGQDALSRPGRVSDGARARARAREPVVQPVRRADRAAVQEAAAVCRVAPRLERDRARLLACPTRGGSSPITCAEESSGWPRARWAGSRSTRWTATITGCGPTSRRFRPATTASSCGRPTGCSCSG